MTIGVARVAPFSMGFDTLGPVSPSAAAAFKADGYRWVARYLETLTMGERDVLFDYGLGIALLLEATAGPLSATVGAQRGIQAVQRAQSLGVPPGVHLTIDNEGTTGSVADVSAAHNATGGVIERNLFVPAMYVGAGQPLDGQQLYDIPNVHLYWKAASLEIPEPTGCGFAVSQVLPLDQVIHGERVDQDMAARDARGRGMVMWWPA